MADIWLWPRNLRINFFWSQMFCKPVDGGATTAVEFGTSSFSKLSFFLISVNLQYFFSCFSSFLPFFSYLQIMENKIRVRGFCQLWSCFGFGSSTYFSSVCDLTLSLFLPDFFYLVLLCRCCNFSIFYSIECLFLHRCYIFLAPFCL